MINHSKKFEQVSIEKLTVDENYQRNLNISRARKIAKNFNPVGVGAILVHKRKDGTYRILDGQHRVKAMEILGFNKVDCDVYEGMSPQEEAQAFQYYNSGNNVTRMQKHVASLAAGDVTSTKIKEIVERCGLQIDERLKGTGIKSIPTLEAIYKSSGENGLISVLYTLSKSFPNDRNAFSKDMMMGMFLFSDSYFGKYDNQKLIQRLQRATLPAVLAKARMIAGAQNYQVYKGVKLAITYYYDYNCKEKLGES